MKTEQLVVVIPFFREQPEWYEEVSVKQAIRVLYHYNHVIVCPTGLSTKQVQGWYAAAGKEISIREFDAAFFGSPQQYNRLMLSLAFYQAFVDYDYILLHQTDAYVFRDDLLEWGDKGYDYVGAPWINWIHASYQAKTLSWRGRLLWRLGKRRFDAVGNGGLSLRRTASMIDLLTAFGDKADTYHLNEDFFFAFEAKKLGYNIQIPGVDEALSFAFDENPSMAFSMAGERLPMACHAWPRYMRFWEKHISNLNAPIPNK